MTDILNKRIVLVLNRNWQAINIRTPADAFCQMATNVATALDIELSDDSRADGDCGGELREGAEEAPEALLQDDSRARRQSLPIHGQVAEAGRRQPRPHLAPLARWRGHVGKPRVVEQGRERPPG